MDGTRGQVSRRRLLAAVGAGSTIALVGTAHAAAAGEPVATGLGAPLVVRESIASASTHLAHGQAVALAYSPNFHERLEEWQRFWWANSPASWVAPFEILTTGAVATGTAFWLTGIRYTQRGQVVSGFDAATSDPRYWSGLASLHAHFPLVRPDLTAARVWIEDGHPGFTGSAEQVAFVRAALSYVWGYSRSSSADWRAAAAGALRRAGRDGDVTTRTGWREFARATTRLGLGTESY
jgi:hypothetical protein